MRSRTMTGSNGAKHAAPTKLSRRESCDISAAGRQIRTVIADPDPVAGNAIAEVLRQEQGFAVVGRAHNVDEIISVVAATSPNLVIADPRMAGFDSELLTDLVLARKLPAFRVIVFTRTGPGCSAEIAIREGAAGFLPKEKGLAQLPVAARAVAAGQGVLPWEELRRLVAHRSTLSDLAGSDARIQSLTKAERRVLRLIADGRSTAEMSEELRVTTGTVKAHVSHILAKLGLRNRAQAAAFAHTTGFALTGQSEGELAGTGER